jgi:hypothetical protein
MATNRIDSNSPALMTIEPTRTRQTERPATPFRDVLATSVGVLTSGAQVATGVVAGPLAAAAVRQLGTSVQGGISGQPLSSAGVSGNMSGGLDAATASAAAGGGNDLASMQAMQHESQVFNMQLLALQNETQQDNQRFSTVSNLMRARHDTAKSAISNIRS